MGARTTILGEKLLYDGRFRLTLTSVEVVESDGAKRRLSHEIYHQKGAAALLLYDPANETVLLVRQFRLGAYLEGRPQPMTEVCAGMLDGDAPAEGAWREVKEETGVEARELAHAFDAFMSPGGMTERISCFTARYMPEDRKGAGGGVDVDEHIEVVEIVFEDALRLIAEGGIRDAKTIALLYHARATGLM